MDPFFDLPDGQPMPNRACARVRDLDMDLPLLSPAYRAVAGLRPLCAEVFAELLTPAWLYDERSPFAESDYRYVVEYVPGFDRLCDHQLCEPALLGRCVNLSAIAEGLVTLLECYTPYKVADRRAALEHRDRLLARARQIEALLS